MAKKERWSKEEKGKYRKRESRKARDGIGDRKDRVRGSNNPRQTTML